MIQSQGSKPVDPFQGKSILSLHPRTFRDFKVSLKSNDLEAIHQHMSLMALQNPDKHFEQAKSVMDGGSEFLNTKENYEPIMKENENPQKNRPALARKRAKFSMKPDTRKPSTFVEPTFQMDQLHDPEDFFAAYEKFENTVKELKRQRGEDPNVPNISTTARQRRPEIPRRKSSYRHHVYSGQPENDTLFSQETLQNTVESQSQPTHDSQNDSLTPNCQSKEKYITGSAAKAEDRVDKLFDDLMSSNIANLDGNEALSYLKDCLKIKPVAVNDFQLPDFHDIPTVNLLPSVNLIKQTLGKQKITFDKPLIPISSPTPPRSPFLAISTFGKLISKSVASESNDPFSAHVTDLFPITTTSEIISGPSSHANKDNIIPVSASADSLAEIIISMKNHNQGNNVEVMDEDIQGNDEDMVEKVPSPTKDNLNDEDINNPKRNLNVEEIIDNLHQEHNTGETVDHVTEKVMSSISVEESVEITTIKDPESNTFHSAQTNGGSVNVQDASVTVQNPIIVQEQQTEEHLKTSMNSRKKTRASKINQKKKRQSAAGQASDSSINILDGSVPVQDTNIVPEQQTEEHLNTSMNNRRKTRGSKIDQKMKRRSLAGAGSSWTTGVRRSNRIKSKPLEYWRGERPLYARLHNSLPTLVGVKFLSPTGKSGFKVESFVADEYKDLVESISLH